MSLGFGARPFGHKQFSSSFLCVRGCVRGVVVKAWSCVGRVHGRRRGRRSTGRPASKKQGPLLRHAPGQLISHNPRCLQLLFPFTTTTGRPKTSSRASRTDPLPTLPQHHYHDRERATPPPPYPSSNGNVLEPSVGQDKERPLGPHRLHGHAGLPRCRLVRVQERRGTRGLMRLLGRGRWEGWQCWRVTCVLPGPSRLTTPARIHKHRKCCRKK